MKIEEKKKKVKNNFSRKRDQYTVVLEELNSQFKVFGEDLAGFRKESEERLNEIEKNQKATLEFLFKIDDRLNEIEKDLKEIKAELKKMNENKADKKELEALKIKVLELEKKLNKAVEWQNNQQKSACA